MVSVSVSKKIGIEKSIGIGFENFWYRKKFRYWFRKNLVSKQVLDSVSKKIGIGNKFWIRFRSDFGVRHTLAFFLRALQAHRAVASCRSSQQSAVLFFQPGILLPGMILLNSQQ